MSKPIPPTKQELSNAIDVFLRLDDKEMLQYLSKLDLSSEQLEVLATRSMFLDTKRHIAQHKNLNDKAASTLVKHTKASDIYLLLLKNNSLSVKFRKSIISKEFISLVIYASEGSRYNSFNIQNLKNYLHPELCQIFLDSMIIKDIIE
jgi:hypothetical protein